MQELRAWAQAHPQEASFGSPGTLIAGTVPGSPAKKLLFVFAPSGTKNMNVHEVTAPGTTTSIGLVPAPDPNSPMCGQGMALTSDLLFVGCPLGNAKVGEPITDVQGGSVGSRIR